LRPMILKTAALISLTSLCLASASAQTHWIGTWAASPSPPPSSEAQMQARKLIFENQTVREIVHISAGGETVRVRLSNAYGPHTIRIGAAHIALAASGSSIVPGSDRTLTFGGQTSISIPPDAPVLSDPVKLDAPPGANVAISVFLPQNTPASGIHYDARETTFIAQGNLTGAASLPHAETIESWVFLTGVDVAAPPRASTIVAFGDSITDGARSSTNANHRWPDFLAARLRAQHKRANIAVVDAGIGGNRILHDASGNVAFGTNALSRFGRDVIGEPGVKYVIVLEGINDIGHAGSSAPESQAVSADEIIGGLKQLIERAHEHGLKIFGATLTPFEGTRARGYFTPEKEVEREAVNNWIRTSGAFDGVVDFDKAIQDSEHPHQMLAKYDSGDHLHPNDAGYQAMAEAINLAWFR
jgi:lysophospholipase L1-like esterase